MSAADRAPGRPGGLKRWLDRIAVGALMTVLVFLVERRLKKVVRTSRGSTKWQPTVRVR